MAWPAEVQARQFFANGGGSLYIVRIAQTIPLADALVGGKELADERAEQSGREADAQPGDDLGQRSGQRAGSAPGCSGFRGRVTS